MVYSLLNGHKKAPDSALIRAQTKAPAAMRRPAVRPERLELSRHKTLEPKSSASANSATGANTIAAEHSVLEATLNSIQGGRLSTEIHFSDRGG